MKTRRRNYADDDDRLTIITQRKSRSKKSTNRTEISRETIPIDLIFEILARLPAKSIAKCRCVSKLWSSMLRRQDFTELYLTRSRTRPQLLLACENGGKVVFFSSPQPQNPDLKNSSPVVVSADQLVSSAASSFWEIIGPVHGLVCLFRVFGMRTVPVICNPTTGQTLVLPEVRSDDAISNLVYDPVDKQFKVLIASLSNDVFDQFHILTIGGTGKKLVWRKMKSCVQPHYSYEKGICIDGVLYYKASSSMFSHRSSMIVCFEARSEKFRFIKLAEDHELGELVNYNGKLGSLDCRDVNGRNGENGGRIELWVLEEDTEEWSKKHTYVPPAMWQEIGIDYLRFVGMTRTNEIVFSSTQDSCLVYYNVERNTIVKVEIQGMEVFEGNVVDIFLDNVEDLNSCKFFNLDLYNLRSV